MGNFLCWGYQCMDIERKEKGRGNSVVVCKEFCTSHWISPCILCYWADLILISFCLHFFNYKDGIITLTCLRGVWWELIKAHKGFQRPKMKDYTKYKASSLALKLIEYKNLAIDSKNSETSNKKALTWIYSYVT